jgi:hypothetical protein
MEQILPVRAKPRATGQHGIADDSVVIPAQAGIQRTVNGVLDARVRGHDTAQGRAPFILFSEVAEDYLDLIRIYVYMSVSAEIQPRARSKRREIEGMRASPQPDTRVGGEFDFFIFSLVTL